MKKKENTLKSTICILGFCICISIVSGCSQKETPKNTIEFTLPDKIDHPEPGWIRHITTRQLIDSLNSESDFNVYFLTAEVGLDSASSSILPDINILDIGQLIFEIEKLSIQTPLILITRFSDDAKMAAGWVSVSGFNCYYLDGGTYRLEEDMKKHGWTFETAEK